jgi:hypothetical protein
VFCRFADCSSTRRGASEPAKWHTSAYNSTFSLA